MAELRRGLDRAGVQRRWHLKTPAYATVFFNGVLVQNHFELKGETLYIGKPLYKKYDTAPIKLQAHGDPSAPISFRNIWSGSSIRSRERISCAFRPTACLRAARHAHLTEPRPLG